MKGLVFREFYLSRKNIIMLSFSLIVFIIIGVLVRLSMLYGNMAKMLSHSEDYESIQLMIYYTFMYMPAFFVFGFNQTLLQNIFSDRCVKWEQFGYASPVSEYRYIGAKFLLMGMLSGLGYLLCLSNAAVMCKMWNRTLDADLILLLLYIVICMMIPIIVECALSYLLKSRKAVIIFESALILCVCGGLSAFALHLLNKFKKLYPDVSDDDISNKILLYADHCLVNVKKFFSDAVPFLLLIFIAVIVMLYFICVKAMKRRER